mgnify:CR=1 FL=1
MREVAADVTGLLVTPGFVDMHAHTGGTAQLGEDSAEYVYKLWLGHGITTVRDPGFGDSYASHLAFSHLALGRTEVAISIPSRPPGAGSAPGRGEGPHCAALRR